MTIEENLALAAGKGGWLHRLTKQEKSSCVNVWRFSAWGWKIA